LKFFKKIVSWLLKIIAVIASLIILYILLAIVLTIVPVNSDYHEIQDGTPVYVSSNGVHVSLIIPAENQLYSWTNQFNKSNIHYNYLAFGWGDKEFYMNTPTWDDIKISTAMEAAFIPTESVIQIYGLRNAPAISKNTRKLNLSDEQLKILSDYIYNSFQFGKDSLPVELFPANEGNNFYKYYRAKGKYTMFFTCNNWASRGLKKAGIKNAVWAPFDKSVLYHLN